MIQYIHFSSVGACMGTAEGETNLQAMVANLYPVLSEEVDVFCFLDHHHSLDFPVWAAICEQEGRTLMLTQEAADLQGFCYEGVWSRITLSVHSSLQATTTIMCSCRLNRPAWLVSCSLLQVLGKSLVSSERYETSLYTTSAKRLRSFLSLLPLSTAMV